VRIKIRPSDDSFYDYFSRAAQNLVKGTSLLSELALPDADVQVIGERLVEVEHDSDTITHELYNKINSSFITPFDREDIYALASRLDDCMDYMEEAADLVELYQVSELPKGVAKQIEIIGRMAELTASAMPRLRSMQDLSEYWIEINRLENLGDKSYRRILAKLFSGKYEALEVLKLKDIVDSLEDAIDAFESVANIVEQIAVKES
jgi:uncharacterized protein